MMICVDIKNVKVGVSFSFFAVIGLIWSLDERSKYELLAILACCVIHELGHIIAMVAFSVPPEKIIAYGGGIKITPDRSAVTSKHREIIILLGGCGVNLVSGLLCYMLRGTLNFFVCADLFLAAFNLLPLKYFDGGRVLEILTDGSKVLRYVRGLIILLAVAFFLYTLFCGYFNLSLTVTLCYLIAAEFMYD